jgi:hypothetical protein
MGSFFYWLYAVGYKLLHRKPKGEPKGNEDKELLGQNGPTLDVECQP